MKTSPPTSPLLLRAASVLGAAIAVHILAACGGAQAPSNVPLIAPLVAGDDTPPMGRLDDRARPLRYQIEFDLDRTSKTLRGRVAIDLRLSRPSKVIWLHGRKLNVKTAVLTAQTTGAPSAEVRAAATPADSELLRIELPKVVGAGQYRLALTYEAEWGNKVGLVRVKPEEPGGLELFISDFEPADARAAFPCFDDPRFKAPFDVSAVAPAQWITLSNSPEIAREALPENRVRLRFAQTSPIPTYLVAVASGDYEATAPTTGDVPMRIWAPRGSVQRVTYLAPKAEKLLSWMSDYLKQPLTLPKLDFWVIPPLSEGTGGMENPGLVTLNASAILPPFSNERSGVHAIAHELAHMWFGNSVTMDWWSDLWLSEGFASWFSDRALAELEPDWSLFFHGTFHPSKVQLKGGERPPVRRAVSATDPADAQQMFNLSTYALGGAVLASWETQIGASAFQGVMQRWVGDHRGGTVTSDQFIEALAPAAKAYDVKVVKEAMRAQLATTTSPAVSVSVVCSDSARVEVAVSALPSSPPTPICLRVAGEATPRCALVSQTLSLPLTTCPAWVVPDPRGGREGLVFGLGNGELSRAIIGKGIDLDSVAALWFRSLGTRDLLALQPGGSSRGELLDAIDLSIRLALNGSPQGLGAFERLAARLYDTAHRSVLLERVRTINGGNIDPKVTDRFRAAFALTLANLGDRDLRKALAAPSYSLSALPHDSAALNRIAFAVDQVQADQRALLSQPLTSESVTVLANTLASPSDRWIQALSAKDLSLYVNALVRNSLAQDKVDQALDLAGGRIESNQLLALVDVSCRAVLPQQVAQRISRLLGPRPRDVTDHATGCGKQRKRWLPELLEVGSGPAPR